MPDTPLIQIIPQLNLLKAAGQFADAYRLIHDTLQDMQSTHQVDEGVIQWFGAAESINRGIGPFSNFIRSYTAEQIHLRQGAIATPATLQASSDAIASAIITDLISSGGSIIPTLQSIGDNDLSGASLIIGDQAGWSGTILFPVLGEDKYLNDLLLSNSSEPYNAVAALHSAFIAADGMISTASDLFAFMGQVLSTAINMPLTAIGTGAQALSNLSTFIFDAYGVLGDLSGDVSLVRAGLLNATDDFSNRAGRELINFGGGDDMYHGAADGDVLDGDAGSDTIDYSSLGSAITITLEVPQIIGSAVRYTGSVRMPGSAATDYLYRVENINASSEDDLIVVSTIPSSLVKVNAGEGHDAVTITDVMQGSRTASFDHVRASSDSSHRVNFTKVEEITLSGELADTLILPAGSNWNYSENATLTVNMGGDGHHVVAGRWERDSIDASELSGGVIAHLDTPIQTVTLGGQLLVNVTSTNAFTGTAFADELYAPDDGGSLLGGGGNDQLHGGDDVDALDGGAGNDKMWSGGGTNLLMGGPGADTIYSEGFGDTVIGGQGDDLIQLGDNATTVRYSSGNGKDLVLTKGGSASMLDLSTLSLSDVSIVVGGEEDDVYWTWGKESYHYSFLSFRVNATGETVTIIDGSKTAGEMVTGLSYEDPRLGIGYAAAHSPIASVVFAGGVEWSAAQLWDYIGDWENHPNVTFDLLASADNDLPGVQHIPGEYMMHINSTYFNLSPLAGPPPQAIDGTIGDDYLNDGLGNDTLQGDGGDDTLEATYGDDLFLWSPGGGHDVIIDYVEGDVDTLRIEGGIAPSDLVLSVEGRSLRISFTTEQGSVLLMDELWSSTSGPGVDRVEFSTGATWTRTQLFEAAAGAINTPVTIQGTSDADDIELPVTAFTVSPGAGDDYLNVVGTGSGTILWGKGDGRDALIQFIGGTRSDALHLRDILPSEVHLNRSNDYMALNVTGTNDSFEVWSQFSPGHQQGLSSIEFADGTIWTRAEILAAVLETTMTGPVAS